MPRGYALVHDTSPYSWLMTSQPVTNTYPETNSEPPTSISPGCSFNIATHLIATNATAISPSSAVGRRSATFSAAPAPAPAPAAAAAAARAPHVRHYGRLVLTAVACGSLRRLAARRHTSRDWSTSSRPAPSRHSTARHSTARHGIARHGTARHGTA